MDDRTLYKKGDTVRGRIANMAHITNGENKEDFLSTYKDTMQFTNLEQDRGEIR